MKNALEKEWKRVLDQEEKGFAMAEKKEIAKSEKKGVIQQWRTGMEEKIPEKLIATLEITFEKAFFTILTKGAGVIEKGFRGEEVALEFQVNDFRIDKKPTKKAVRQIEKAGKQSRLVNSCFTTVEGIGLGALGIGLPDIPIFLAILLKGLYETATSYGFDYKEEREQVCMLYMIQGAFAVGEDKRRVSKEVDIFMKQLETGEVSYDLKEEVCKASKCLSQGMLTSKFVQGFFLIGAVGGAMNLLIYRQVIDYALLKYKKRYIMTKRKDV